MLSLIEGRKPKGEGGRRQGMTWWWLMAKVAAARWTGKLAAALKTGRGEHGGVGLVAWQGSSGEAWQQGTGW